MCLFSCKSNNIIKIDLQKYNYEIETITLTDRITARDEYGTPYYCGRHTMRNRAYVQDIELSAIAEILEKLCQYEELDEEDT